jgi:cell division protein FtsI/penicillin-binding protein 2
VSAEARLTRRGILRVAAGGAGLLLGACSRGAPPVPPSLDDAELRDALERAAERSLHDEGDAAALIALDSGRLLLEHHSLVLRQRRMPSGSVFKLFTAAALLETGVRTDEYRCSGKHTDPFGAERPCWLHAGHGPMRLRAAISSSCNAWFYEHATKLDPMAFLDVCGRFGLGRRFESDLPAVATDLMPGTARTRDLPDLAVGDDWTLQVTPLSLLRATTAIATRGRLITPARAGALRAAPVGLAPTNLDSVAEGMREATRSGTLRGVFGPHDVAAKTGTAKRREAADVRYRGLVVAFTPSLRPRYALVVVKHAGKGAADAGPPARALVDELAARGALA